MIQRIQSVYLLLVTILWVVAICMPVGQFIGADGEMCIRDRYKDVQWERLKTIHV